MKKYFFIFLMMILSIHHLHAQNDNIQNKIMNNTSQTTLINKARLLLLDEFITKNFDEVKHIKNYLNYEIDNENYVGLFDFEDILLSYWTQEYFDILSQINLLKIQFDNVKVTPEKDNLFLKVQSESIKNYYALVQSIKKSDIDVEDKDFLELLLNYLISEKFNYALFRGVYMEDDKLDVLGAAFLNKYPESKYSKFVNDRMRNIYTKSDWAIGADIFSGYGISTGNAAINFKNHVPIGVGFDIYYKKYVLYLRDYIGFDRTLNDINYNGVTWNKKSQVRIYLPEASLGYPIISGKKLRMTPFAGISGLSYSPTLVDINENKDLKVFEKFTSKAVVGLNMDFIFSNMSTGYLFNKDDELFIRLRYGLNYSNSNKYPYFSGNIHYITVGIGGLGGLPKRRK